MSSVLKRLTQAAMLNNRGRQLFCTTDRFETELFFRTAFEKSQFFSN